MSHTFFIDKQAEEVFDVIEKREKDARIETID